MNILEISVLGISGGTLVTLVVSQFKALGLFANNGPLAALVAGWLVAGLYQVHITLGAGKTPGVDDGVAVLVLGLLLGPVGSGIHSHISKQNEKAVAKKAERGPALTSSGTSDLVFTPNTTAGSVPTSSGWIVTDGAPSDGR